jgi:hypothetical protein
MEALSVAAGFGCAAFYLAAVEPWPVPGCVPRMGVGKVGRTFSVNPDIDLSNSIATQHAWTIDG